jgi:hypothetical protein
MQKIITLCSILLVVIFLTGCGKKQASLEKTGEKSSSSEQDDRQPGPTEGMTYTNGSFGLRVVLPAGWEKCRVVDQEGINQEEPTIIHMLMPTTDADWPGHYVSEEETKKGYASMFSMRVWKVSSWDEKIASKECQTAQPGCPIEADVFARNSEYVFDASFAQAYPNDSVVMRLIPALPNGTMGLAKDFLKDKFKLLVK